MHLKTNTGTNAVTLEGFEGGRYYAKTVFHDDKALEQNAKIRNSGMLTDGALGLHDDADIRMAISCPSTLQWSIFKMKHAETHKLLHSTDEQERMKGARQLQLLHPEWIVMDRL